MNTRFGGMSNVSSHVKTRLFLHVIRSQTDPVPGGLLEDDYRSKRRNVHALSYVPHNIHQSQISPNTIMSRPEKENPSVALLKPRHESYLREEPRKRCSRVV